MMTWDAEGRNEDKKTPARRDPSERVRTYLAGLVSVVFVGALAVLPVVVLWTWVSLLRALW